MSPEYAERYRDLTRWTYRDSKLFAAVLDPGQVGDLRAEVEITDVGTRKRALVWLSNLTLGLVPVRSSARLKIHTDFKGPDGTVLGSFESSDSVIQWRQLFLVFAMPFFSSNAAIDMIVDLNRATLAQAHAADVL